MELDTIPAAWITSAHPLETEIILPGFSPADVDRSQQVALHKVALQGEIAQFQTYLLLSGKQGIPINANHTFFLKSAWYGFEPGFYDTSEHLNGLVMVGSRVGNVGKSSYQRFERTLSVKSGRALHRSVVTLVTVDNATRRPTTLDDTTRSVYGNWVEPVTKVEYIPEATLGENRGSKSFISSYEMRWSDSDYNRHVNQSSYVRICLDAITEVAVSLTEVRSTAGEHPLFNLGDPAFLKAKSMTTLYLGETIPGDSVDVRVWWDAENDSKVVCDMTNGGKTVFQMTITYCRDSIIKTTISDSRL